MKNKRFYIFLSTILFSLVLLFAANVYATSGYFAGTIPGWGGHTTLATAVKQGPGDKLHAVPTMIDGRDDVQLWFDALNSNGDWVTCTEHFNLTVSEWGHFKTNYNYGGGQKFRLRACNPVLTIGITHEVEGKYDVR